MADFKGSNLISVLKAGDMLTQDAWDFVDACMDDFYVDEMVDGNVLVYELRSLLTGQYRGREVSVTQIYYGDLSGMAALIEHLALTNMLLMKHNGMGGDE